MSPLSYDQIELGLSKILFDDLQIVNPDVVQCMGIIEMESLCATIWNCRQIKESQVLLRWGWHLICDFAFLLYIVIILHFLIVLL